MSNECESSDIKIQHFRPVLVFSQLDSESMNPSVGTDDQQLRNGADLAHIIFPKETDVERERENENKKGQEPCPVKEILLQLRGVAGD